VPLTLFVLVAATEQAVETRALPSIPAGTCLEGESLTLDPALAVDGGIVVHLYDDGFGTTPTVECNINNDQAAADLTLCR